MLKNSLKMEIIIKVITLIYGEYMDNNEDFKEEFREELDVNKLYSKKKYNN